MLGLRCLGYVPWFSTWCRALPRGPAVGAAYPAAGCPWGVSDFPDTVCLPFCCAGGVGWATTLPYVFSSLGRQFSSAFWLHLPLGLGKSPSCFVISSCGSRLLCGLCGSLIALPCLRVGALLACGVYGSSSLRRLQSQLHFVVSPPFLVSVVLHLLLWWGGLVTCRWPLLLLLWVGLLWGVCSALLWGLCSALLWGLCSAVL